MQKKKLPAVKKAIKTTGNSEKKVETRPGGSNSGK
jgi:hypothetical protein